MAQTWTVKAALDWCEADLARCGDENPRLSAQLLVCAATGLSRVELYVNFEKPLTLPEREVLREGVRRRRAGEPLQYIAGEAAFRHVVVKVAPGVLIPRPETEVLVQCALDWAAGESAPLRALEVGCGSGCVAASLAKEAGISVLATDVAPAALECTRANVAALGLDALIEVAESDCGAGVEGPFDLLISNPPYIPTSVLATLPEEVRGHEPALALDGGPDGLTFFRRLLALAPSVLREGGLFACELHETTLEQAKKEASSAGLKNPKIISDLTGRPRILQATL